jgi:hypothetical protein
MINAAQEFGQYPLEAEAPLEELERRYAGYWEAPLEALRSDGIQ